MNRACKAYGVAAACELIWTSRNRSDRTLIGLCLAMSAASWAVFMWFSLS